MGRLRGSKTAMLSVSKVLAAESGPKGVRSNVIAPGPTRTWLWRAGRLRGAAGGPVRAAGGRSGRPLCPGRAAPAQRPPRHPRRRCEGDRIPPVAAGDPGHRGRNRRSTERSPAPAVDRGRRSVWVDRFSPISSRGGGWWR
ncbi:SDR family oxidoreductase [Saccharopolyspora pogona]